MTISLSFFSFRYRFRTVISSSGLVNLVVPAVRNPIRKARSICLRLLFLPLTQPYFSAFPGQTINLFYSVKNFCTNERPSCGSSCCGQTVPEKHRLLTESFRRRKDFVKSCFRICPSVSMTSGLVAELQRSDPVRTELNLCNTSRARTGFVSTLPVFRRHMGFSKRSL